MSRSLTYIDTIIYYDGPQLVRAEDQLRTKYLCTLISRDEEADSYLCIPVSPDVMNQFMWGEIDLLSIILNSETGEAFIGETNEEHFENLPVSSIPVSELDPHWLPDPGLTLDEQISDESVIHEAITRKRAIFYFSLNPPEARTELRIKAESLQQAIYIIQRLVKHAFHKSISLLDPANRALYNIPENYELEVIGVTAGSFTVQMQNKALMGLFGYSPIDKAFSLLDEVNTNTESAQETVDLLAKYGGHFVVAYRDLVKFMVDNDAPISYQWTTPEKRQINKRRITAKQAKPIYDLLVERNEITKEKLTITGIVIGIHIERKTWDIRDQKEGKLHHGTVFDAAGISLAGVTPGKLYEFNCEEELLEERSTGKETTRLYLVSYRELSQEILI